MFGSLPRLPEGHISRRQVVKLLVIPKVVGVLQEAPDRPFHLLQQLEVRRQIHVLVRPVIPLDLPLRRRVV